MTEKENMLITPYGGHLVDLVDKDDKREELIKKAGTYHLSNRPVDATTNARPGAPGCGCIFTPGSLHGTG